MLLTLLVVSVTLASCSLCTTTEYIDRPVEVLVEVPCKVNNVVCDLTGTDPEVVVGLMRCVVDLRQEASRCSK